nr:hypothetical protein [uncultured Roseateles sp.]
MILGGLPEVQFITRTREQVYRESIVVLKKYLEDHKIEALTLLRSCGWHWQGA